MMADFIVSISVIVIMIGGLATIIVHLRGMVDWMLDDFRNIKERLLQAVLDSLPKSTNTVPVITHAKPTQDVVEKIIALTLEKDMSYPQSEAEMVANKWAPQIYTILNNE